MATPELCAQSRRTNSAIESGGLGGLGAVIMTQALSQVIDRWRATADVWEMQLEDEPKMHAFKVIDGVDRPPSRNGRATIQNWINWLRACADEVEAAAKSVG